MWQLGLIAHKQFMGPREPNLASLSSSRPQSLKIQDNIGASHSADPGLFLSVPENLFCCCRDLRKALVEESRQRLDNWRLARFKKFILFQQRAIHCFEPAGVLIACHCLSFPGMFEGQLCPRRFENYRKLVSPPISVLGKKCYREILA